MTADQVVTRREAEVLALIGEHLTNAEIAARLYISQRTVESHVSALLRKLGVADRRKLARQAAPTTTPVRCRVLPPPGPPSLPPALALLADDNHVRRSQRRAGGAAAAMAAARAGHTLIVVITAEAGMGKSRLVSELATEVHAAGGRVLLGACHEDVDEPYGPFVEAIADDAGGLGSAEARRRAGDAVDTLARLSLDLAAFSAPASGQQPSDDVDAFERSMVLDAIRQWFIDGAAAGPSLLVVEDLHWSTSTTRNVLRHLARRAGRDPLLVVTTARDSKPDFDADLVALLADLERLPTVRRLSLSGLDPAEVGELVGSTPDEAKAIRADTGGNPLLVTHMSSYAGQRSLPAWLVRRDALLDDESRAVLDQAATFGSEFDADRLAAAHGAPLLPVLECLEAADAAGLIAPHPSRIGWFTFVHALFRAHRYGALPLRRRLELHRGRPPRSPHRSTTRASSPSGRGMPVWRSRWATPSRRSSWPAPPPSTPSRATRTTRRSPTIGVDSRRPASWTLPMSP